ncbi:MAG: hypothetical protein BGO69_18520 [Bacteroidetes bacterium 46-16]|nr:MAG: hypothetical protein BGO69_18520 [Bacteroidetes bacterium 46-16]
MSNTLMSFFCTKCISSSARRSSSSFLNALALSSVIPSVFFSSFRGALKMSFAVPKCSNKAIPLFMPTSGTNDKASL